MESHDEVKNIRKGFAETCFFFIYSFIIDNNDKYYNSNFNIQTFRVAMINDMIHHFILSVISFYFLGGLEVA